MKVLLGCTSLVIIMSATGCSKKMDGHSSSDSGWKTTNLSKNPVRLKKQDDSCLTIFSTGEDVIFSIEQLIDGNLNFINKNFTNQIYGNYVESSSGVKPISITQYGLDTNLVVDVTFDSTSSSYELTPGTDFINEENSYSKKLDVCPATNRYYAYSYEGSGLNISYSINRTYNAVKNALPSISLPSVSVEVAPIIRKDIKFRGGPNNRKHIDGYETDNAYYNSKDKKITFLPQSKTSSLKESNTPYWQIPMVASHEYGHHIFQTLILDNTSSEIKHSGACFQNHTTMKNSIYKVQGGLRDNTSSFAMGSINEGFADLIAFYALGKIERKLTAVGCFTQNREVDSPVFGSDQSKAFNNKALRLINTQKTHEADRDCDTPNYQEIHDVGALFAYGANYLISKSTDDKSKKLTIILKWAKKLATEYSELENLEAGEFLFASLELVLKTTLQESSTAVFDKCALMDELFVDNHGYSCKYLD
jgi:hypothetical protein